MARSTARKRALNTLYEADEKGQDLLSLLDERIAQPGAPTPLPQYAIEMVRGVAEHKAAIDAQLNEHSTGWKVDRMAVIDRNILRMAVWEIEYNPEVPDAVAIDEALALAKTLSDGSAPAFIHGLLSAVADSAVADSAVVDSAVADAVTTHAGEQAADAGTIEQAAGAGTTKQAAEAGTAEQATETTAERTTQEAQPRNETES